MIHLSNLKNKSFDIERPSCIKDLYDTACKLFGTELSRLYLVEIAENQDKTFIEQEAQYQSLCSHSNDISLVAYIKPKQYTKLQKRLIGGSLAIFYVLGQVFFNMPFGVFDILNVLMMTAVESFEMIRFIVVNMSDFLYWIPFVIPLAHLVYIGQHWIEDFMKKRVSKTKLAFLLFFSLTLIPNAIGFLCSMLSILWFVLALLNIALHKKRPLTSKDLNFLLILSGYLFFSSARVVYFY